MLKCQGKQQICISRTKVNLIFSQYMLQLQASKLVNRKDKAKQDKNSNIPQQDPNLNIKEKNICLKVEIISNFRARAVGFGFKW